MLPRAAGLVLPLALLPGCPGPWPDIVSCEDLGACSTGAAAPTTDTTPPTTGGVQTVTGDESGPADGPGGSTGATGSTELPQILGSPELDPSYLAHPGRIAVTVHTAHADRVDMQLDATPTTPLTPDGPGRFVGEILAFTGLENGPHTARFTPRQGELVGTGADAAYILALPAAGDERFWDGGGDGLVAALAVLPDGRPVELGTYHLTDTPRCYLRLRDPTGPSLAVVDLLAPAHCRAIDLAVDPDEGALRVLLERETPSGLVWWAGELPGWDASPVKLAQGLPGETALALAAHHDLVAVCGALPGEALDPHDALAVLLRPGQPADLRRLKYEPNFPIKPFAETARDCAFADDGTLVLVGEAHGPHFGDPMFLRDRLFLLELDPASAAAPTWTVADPGPGVQSRALAVAVGDDGLYYLAGTSCLDACAPEGLLRVHAPGGALADQLTLGPLGPELMGPHDLAWSPAGYAVVALGDLQGQASQFKVLAFALGEPEPLWTFIAVDKAGLQLATAVAVSAVGEVFAGGLGPAFAVLGG
jgi:hypothetical protein